MPTRATGPRSAANAVQRYLAGLIPHLEVLCPSIRHQYEVPGLGRLTTLRHAGYRLFETDSSAPRSFGFGFESIGETCLVTRPGVALLDAHRARLRSVGLGHQTIRAEDRGHVVVVPPRVPVELRFEHDDDLGILVVKTMNLQVLGPQRFAFPVERIDSGWMQALARCIVRRPNALRAFMDLERAPRRYTPHPSAQMGMFAPERLARRSTRVDAVPPDHERGGFGHGHPPRKITRRDARIQPG